MTAKPPILEAICHVSPGLFARLGWMASKS